MTEIHSPLPAQIVEWRVQAGVSVCAGDLLLVLEAMKMAHELRAAQAGRLVLTRSGCSRMAAYGNQKTLWTKTAGVSRNSGFFLFRRF